MKPPARLARSASPRGFRRGLPGVAALVVALVSGPARADSTVTTTQPAVQSAGVPLTVRVRGLRNERGRVAVALFASAGSFPDQKRALAGQVVRVQRGGAAVTFPGLRPGVYAVAVLHDENSNAKMDFNFLGMPLEGYGFSNDASAPFGPPGFAAAAFRLLGRPSAVAVKVRYLL